LIVDDQPYNIQALKVMIGMIMKTEASLICSRAFNGKEALEIVEESIEQDCRFNLILMDCNMPIMDGYEATIAIRELMDKHELPQPVICAVTGHVEEEYI
jgi:CheY-like chemotaxis protein